MQSIETNSIRVDPILSNKANDLRRGLTLIARPSGDVELAVMKFLEEARQIEPNQYYYQSTELHTTVLAIVTCSVDFKLDETDIAPYIDILTESIASFPPIRIAYRGITASPDCVMVQGYPLDSALQDLRERIRGHFRKAGVKSTLDQRFKTHTAHLTCLRFQNPILKQPEQFLQFLQRNRDFDFGICEISELEFVANDWYMSDEHVDVIHRFP
ncbi:2'-5' RNA ligase family protein [Alicyclobacillus fastidiosus]|uniref:2'-5' RNA ligase n=1 Tax=Alicyclobacillus fastidiosus TaxID=392011 RepID=A0ABV5ACH5_9BACL|nr:hypothetical protein [Alicyclobacillus fastidiosus]WEH11366.1 hypothetical protein PYS47_09210 [Alicyclobacillus fastidiosus]